MTNWINDNGTWKEASQPWINDGGTWKEIDTGWINDNGTWKEYFTAVSPPDTYFTQSIRNDTSNGVVSFSQSPNNGDLILILIEEETDSANPSIASFDTSYTVEVAVNNGNNNQYVVWKFSDGTETDFSYSIEGNDNRVIVSFIQNVNQTTPFASTNTTTDKAFQTTVNQPNALDIHRVIILFTSDDDNGAGPWNWDSGHITTRLDASGSELDGVSPTSSVSYFQANVLNGDYSAVFSPNTGNPTHIKTVLLVNGD